MKEYLKKQNGIAAIAVVLIVVLSVAAGGTAFLGVRSVVTGEPFLQPFEDLGLIELDDDKEDSDKKSEKTENTETDKKNLAKGQSSSLLLSEIEEDGVECYTIKIDLKEVADGIMPYVEKFASSMISSSSMYGDTTVEDNIKDETISSILDLVAEMFEDCEIIVDCYANGNDVKQLLVTVPYEQFVENVYNKIGEIEEFGKEIDENFSLDFDYASYEECLADFEDTFESEVTTEKLREALSDELGSEYADLVDSAECVMENGKIQISMDLTSIDLDSYIEDYSEELEELGIDPENVVETAVETWNEYIDEKGYDGLIEEVMSAVTAATSLMGY